MTVSIASSSTNKQGILLGNNHSLASGKMGKVSGDGGGGEVEVMTFFEGAVFVASIHQM